MYSENLSFSKRIQEFSENESESDFYPSHMQLHNYVLGSMRVVICPVW